MIRRAMVIAVAGSLLSGCSWGGLSKAEPVEPEQRPRSISIGWVDHDWRLCEEDETCPKPTPKTVVLPALLPAAVTPPKQAENEPASKPDVTHHVRFPFSMAVPTKDGAAQLTKILRDIRKTHVIHITGYTDNIGGVCFNERLAQRRAEFVAAWLKRRGVRAPMEIEARGKCCYLASNETKEGRAANRRAEVVLRERQGDLASSKTSTNQKGDR